VKNDPSTPPTDASAIQAVTPSDVFSWSGPGEHLTQSSARTGIENNWFALAGRVLAVKVEMDGDLHLALQDATGEKVGGAPIITVTGKAYWDVGHAPKDQSNRRSHLPGYVAWEVHPVMGLQVVQ
jgi:hypothetical protein